MSPVVAVVFDLDGTLFDHQVAASHALDAWLAGQGIAVSDELARAWFEVEDRHFAAWRDGLVTVGEQRRGRLREFLPLLGIPSGRTTSSTRGSPATSTSTGGPGWGSPTAPTRCASCRTSAW